jgi:hypothetical protein
MIRTGLVRKAAAILGAAAVGLGFGQLSAVHESLAATSTPSTGAPSTSAASAGTKVTGPRMWNPVTQRRFARHATVTVSQTTSLVNQVVRVSWTGFTPSGNVLYDPDATDYPVMVAECNTDRPRFWRQCYGANNGGVEGAFGAFGPMNTAYATTSPNGTGQVDIQVLTALENQLLDCGVHHPCSLIIVPSQGGNTLESPAVCSDHSVDAGGTDEGQYAFSSQTGQCSWADRIIVPLSFAPAPTNCPIRNANFTALGSPMLARAMYQWLAALCAGANPLTVTYNAEITEPEAIQDVPLGLGDIALTTRPGPAHILGKRTYTYAPVAISAVSIAYWVDNPVTGEPVTKLKLDPRLVAKLLTQSYDFQNEGCGHGAPPKGIGCDGAVDGNPFSLFADPEFKQLNPRVQTPVGFGAAFQVPTVESGESDMTWETTRWIASNPAAAGFMQGQFDPWGMHLNTDYLGLKYPVNSFTSQDNFPVIEHKYSPVFPLSAVAGYQVANWDPGTDYEKDQYGNFPKDPIQIPGERGLFAILDQGDAAAFRFPVAEIENSKGRYVVPSDKSMAAALPAMVASGSNHITQDVDYAKLKAGAYPLTMVIYAMVPTSGVSAAKASAIARFLDFVAGPGQVRGDLPGDLPPGYLPLPASLRAQTEQAATKVLDQAGGSSPSPSATAPTGSPTAAPASPTPTPPPRPGQGIVTITLRSAQTTGLSRYVFPVLLIAGGVAALAGASSLVVAAAGTAVAGRLRRRRRVRLAWRRKQ